MNEQGIAEGNLEDIRAYLQKDYWESGHDLHVSGYQNAFINWWWINRWMQCFNAVFPVRDQRILDLGCGYGAMVAGFVTWGADAYGIDLSDYGIAKGKKEADYLEQRLVQGSIHDLSAFPDQSFDLLYSNQVFEHLPEKYVDDLVKEMWRVCRPGGRCWLAFVISKEENGRRQDDDPDLTHINIHSMNWWRKRFASAGFIENTVLNQAVKRTTTGYDHYSYYAYYKWHSIVLEKPLGERGPRKKLLHQTCSTLHAHLPPSFRSALKKIPGVVRLYRRIQG